MRPHRIFAVLLTCAAASVAFSGDLAEQDAAAVLVRHGLKRIDRVWMAAEELRLRQDLAELPKCRERILALERDLDERIEANRKLWLEAQPAIAVLRKSLAKIGTDDPQRALIQQQIDAAAGRLRGAGEARRPGRGPLPRGAVDRRTQRPGDDGRADS